MRKTLKQRGFTLVELMVALIVTGIIMSAVATLAFAFRSAYDVTDDTDSKQAQVRYTTLKISELVRHCKLICALSNGELVIWLDDDVPGGEHHINPEEIVYIETSGNQIRILSFVNCPTWFQTYQISLSWLSYTWIKTTISTYCDEEYVVAVPECDNVQFQFDTSPPQTKFVSISFDLTENGSTRQYHIDNDLRCWAGYLLNAAGTDLTTDDD
jgi:prepilin-type N-terminal cleavage/methylation domain-containing protein